MLTYDTIDSLCRAAEEAGQPISQVVLADQAEQMEASPQALYARMLDSLKVMQNAVQAGMAPDLRSASGLSGGDAAKMQAYAATGGLTGTVLNRAMARALAVSEYNACMGKIVAAPTAGSCGIIPGTLLSVLDEGRCTEHQAVMALFTAGAVGMVIANRAFIAGAQGGCQAECGSAAAMAAAALVEVSGGTPRQCADACAMALKNQLGLVCDPVAGLVEVPCVNRNVMGAVNALACAEMALSGVESAIPCDEVIDAMRAVGDALPASLRETGGGGLAATPTGRRIAEQV